MKTVLCLNVPELAAGGWRDHQICKKYPGSGFLPYLRADLNVVSANEIVNCPAKEMVLVQEEENELGRSLLEKGAKGGVLFCLESPLFSPLFYDGLADHRKRFQRQFMYQGGTDPVFFPSFDQTKLQKPEPWLGRRPRFCMVMSNKHWKPYEQINGWKESRSWQKAIQLQLHDQRYTTIAQLQNLKILDLFGKGWPPGMNAPELPAGEKNDTLRRYNFGLCIENMSMPGYVTEKIIDCIVAGVIPVYMGAPDIAQYVPEECFMHLQKFRWPTPKAATDMIEAGQAFLRSEPGKKFSYQSFAKQILQSAQSSGFAPKPSPGPSSAPPDLF